MIVETPEAVGGSWSASGEIIYAVPTEGLYRVRPGEEPVAVTRVESGKELHALPHLLPGGDSILFSVLPAVSFGGSSVAAESPRIAIVPVDGGEVRILAEGSDAKYARSGHLVYYRAGALMAVGFDAAAGVTIGDAREVRSDVWLTCPHG